MTDRILPLQGGYNFRDLGGYKTPNQGMVKDKLLYRSGDLNQLTAQDLARLEKIDIKTVIDFRTPEEQKSQPSKLPPSVKNIINLPIEAGNIINLSKIKTAQEAEQAMIQVYLYFVDEAKEQYRKFFKTLEQESNCPLLFHCSAGKDRTGFAAAMFLSALQVDRETIYADYLLSAKYVEEKYHQYIKDYPYLIPVFTVKKEYLEAAFNKIEKDYGGVKSYLTKELEVNTEALKSIYTTI